MRVIQSALLSILDGDSVDIRTLAGVLLAVAALFIMFSANRLAARYMKRRYPELDFSKTEYKEKHLNRSFVYKAVAAGTAVAALILTLI